VQRQRYLKPPPRVNLVQGEFMFCRTCPVGDLWFEGAENRMKRERVELMSPSGFFAREIRSFLRLGDCRRILHAVPEGLQERLRPLLVLFQAR
jgi:hypothetical protein